MESTKEIMNELAHDFENVESRRKLVELFGDENDTFFGKNVDGEDVAISFDTEAGMVLKTNQKNGWVRVNYYDKDGNLEGETFDGRWQLPSEM